MEVRAALTSSASCILLVSHAVLEVRQSCKVAPHSPQTRQNLDEETRKKRRRRRKTVSLRVVTTSPPFQSPNEFITGPAILSVSLEAKEGFEATIRPHTSGGKNSQMNF